LNGQECALFGLPSEAGGGSMLICPEQEAGESKKGAILFVAALTKRLSIEISKLSKAIISLTKFDSGQLMFLG
jgi:hypothetical protein